MRTSDFDYELPKGRIAQKPASPRESARLLVLDRTHDMITHSKVRQLPDLLRKGDVLVINVSKVFKARLIGRLDDPGKSAIELFLVRPEGTHWRTLAKPGRKLKPGSHVAIAKGFIAKIIRKDEDGSVLVDFGETSEAVIRKADRHGQVPLPPYITRAPRASEYQTAYARNVGSVAAPTAGFHLTKALIADLQKKGVIFLEVTLHVGLGTFFPIRAENIGEHAMHAEWVEIPAATAQGIRRAKAEGRRVVAVGTTSVRALEGAAAASDGKLRAWRGDVNLFISPSFRFRVVDALLTNFHLPKSTLLVLVSALAGRERVLEAYAEAVRKKYRFYSYGDAMLIV